VSPGLTKGQKPVEPIQETHRDAGDQWRGASTPNVHITAAIDFVGITSLILASPMLGLFWRRKHVPRFPRIDTYRPNTLCASPPPRNTISYEPYLERYPPPMSSSLRTRHWFCNEQRGRSLDTLPVKEPNSIYRQG
jgi:hypothetical protein